MSNRHTAVRLSFAALVAILGLSMSMMTFAQSSESSSSSSSTESASAESSATSVVAPTGFGTITIEQKNSSLQQALGSWTLLTPYHHNGSGSLATQTLTNMPAGTYTLIMAPPNGVTTSIRTYHNNNEQVDYVQRPQITFKLVDGEVLRIVANYSLTRTGDISIQSDPPGIEFSLSGPDDIREKGETPASFTGYPVGQYSLKFGTLEGCPLPAPQSSELKEDGRASFSVTFSCKSADKIRERVETKSDKYVVVTIDGVDVQLRDVPQDSWFSTYVFDVARRGVLSGYKDEAGKPSGEFGPGNPVTVAELAKVAHRLAGVGEEGFNGKNPENGLALGQWFSPFIASAEARGWTLYKDATVDPLRNVTRAEVMVTLLQVMDVPLEWQKGDLFNDVTVRTRFASAIETAARDGVIEGLTDEDGKPLHTFNPEGAINRAELSKILTKVFEIYQRKSSAQSSRKS
jgi:hypothetical protein